MTKQQLLEKFNITEEQAKYIQKEMKGLNIKNINRIKIVNTGTATEKGDLIQQVVFDENKHICYI